MHKPIVWQTRLVEILHIVQNEVSTRILFELLKVDNNWLTRCIVSRLSDLPDELLKSMKGIDIDFSRLAERIRLGTRHLKIRNHGLNELDRIEKFCQITKENDHKEKPPNPTNSAALIYQQRIKPQ